MSLRRKLLFLLVWWLGCGVCAVVFYQGDQRYILPTISEIARKPDTAIGRNGTGACSIGRFDPGAGCKPAFRVAWSNLHAENGRLSVFKTPMYKTVVVDDLDIKSYSYFYPAYSPYSVAGPREGESDDEAGDFPPGPRARAPLVPAHSRASAKTVAVLRPIGPPYAARAVVAAEGDSRYPASGPVGAAHGRSGLPRSDFRGGETRGGRLSGLTQALSGAAEEFRSGLKGFEVESPAFTDVSNTTKVVIRNLNYSLFADGDLDLGVRCANATVTSPVSEVVLRGCVIITAGDGSRLMSNCVQWDMEANQFTVPGTFVLSREGSLTRGRGLRCDRHLEPLRANKVRVEEPMPVYRFYSVASGSHFYTISERERRRLTERHSDRWAYEGITCFAYPPDRPPSGTRPVYRLRRTDRNTYFLTMNESEKEDLVSRSPEVWTSDGIAFYAYPEDYRPARARPVYRFWSGTAQTHFYTMSESERDKLIHQGSQVWTYEGIAWFAQTGSSGPEVCDAGPAKVG